MHIVYLVESIDQVGGIERSLTARVNYLAEVYNYRVTIICTLKETGIPTFTLHKSVDLIFLEKLVNKKSKLARLFLIYKQSKKIVLDLKPDIVISVKFTLHNLFFKLISSPVRYISEVREPRVQADQNLNDSLKTILLKKIRNYILKRQGVMIVLTSADKKAWGFDNIKVVPNPQTITTSSVSDLSKRRVLALGRLHKVKGFDKLLDVWKIVNSRHPEWELKICGKGEEYQNLSDKIKRLNLGDSVLLTNEFLPVIPEFLDSSIFVLPSQFEAFGNVLVEAKICGVPAVSFDSPCGPKEIINDEEDGFIVGYNNLIEMANRINYLIENLEVRIEMGKKAKINSKKFELVTILELY